MRLLHSQRRLPNGIYFALMGWLLAEGLVQLAAQAGLARLDDACFKGHEFAYQHRHVPYAYRACQTRGTGRGPDSQLARQDKARGAAGGGSAARGPRRGARAHSPSRPGPL